MNTSGFAEAYENAVTVQISESITVLVISLAGLAVLKFVAYDDRLQERHTDLQDIWFLAKNYLAATGEDRLYEDTDLMNDENFDFRTVSARFLGRDVAELLTEQTGEIVFKHLSENDGEGMENTARVISIGERRLEEDFEEIIETLRKLKEGIAEGLARRQGETCEYGV